MNGVYKSLKVKMQDTFQMGKPSPAPELPSKSISEASLNDEMENLETIVTEGFTKLKAAIKQGEATLAGEALQAEQVIGTLTANVAALEAKLKEAEEAVRQNDSSRQQIEETLKAKIHDLQNELKAKEQQIAVQAKDIDDLRFNFDAKVKQVSELEAASARAKEEAVSYAARADDLAGASRSKIEKLEAQLKEKEELARQKDPRLKELEQRLAAKIQDFDSLAKSKQELLAGRDAVISDLKSQLKLLTKGIGEMSSFFKQAQAFAVVDRQDASPSFPHAAVNSREEKPLRQPDNAKVAPLEEEKSDAAPPRPAAVPFSQEKRADVLQLQGATIAASNGVNSAPAEKPVAAPQSNGQSSGPIRNAEPEILPQEVLERMSGELAEVAGLMSPLASLIVREHVEGLGESLDSFPKNRVPELIESLSRELLDENREDDFRKRLISVQVSTFSR